MTPYEYAIQYRNSVRRWIIYHVISLVCVIAGLIGAEEYMLAPDHIICLAADRSVLVGRSYDIASAKLEKDIARKGCYALLERSHQYWNKALCEAIYGKSAMTQAEGIIRDSSEHFMQRKIQQLVTIKEIKVFQDDRQSCRVFIHGNLTRIGNYIGFPYEQGFRFRFNVKLVRSPEAGTFPMRILKIFYEEKEIYNSESSSEDKKEQRE